MKKKGETRTQRMGRADTYRISRRVHPLHLDTALGSTGRKQTTIEEGARETHHGVVC